MVSKEGQPALGSVRISPRSFPPTRDSSLGKVKTENEGVPMQIVRTFYAAGFRSSPKRPSHRRGIILKIPRIPKNAIRMITGGAVPNHIAGHHGPTQIRNQMA